MITPAQQWLTIPVAAGEYAYLLISPSLTSEQWYRLMAILSAMKPGLVESKQ